MSLLVKHFVLRPKAIAVLATLDLSETEKQQLAETITLIYHQKLLNEFLEVLSMEDRKLFLENYLNGDQEKSIQLLHEKIVGIENIVNRALGEIEEKIIAQVENLKG